MCEPGGGAGGSRRPPVRMLARSQPVLQTSNAVPSNHVAGSSWSERPGYCTRNLVNDIPLMPLEAAQKLSQRSSRPSRARDGGATPATNEHDAFKCHEKYRARAGAWVKNSASFDQVHNDGPLSRRRCTPSCGFTFNKTHAKEPKSKTTSEIGGPKQGRDGGVRVRGRT